jgi:hypothetical protein
MLLNKLLKVFVIILRVLVERLMYLRALLEDNQLNKSLNKVLLEDLLNYQI